jgi:hypothetical protein
MNAEPTRDSGPAVVLTRHAHRIVYATIVLIVALGRFDSSDNPESGTVLELTLITVGPLLVLAVAHAFADSLSRPFTVAAGDVLGSDRSHLTSGLVYPAVAIPVLILAIGLSALGQEPLLAAQISQTSCWLSLGVWGFAGARRRGRPLSRQLGAAVLYMCLGLVVVLTELFLLR